jgi:hypothetical protein
VLKPQDVYVALKIAAVRSDRPPYSKLAADLVMSPSEVHASVQRAQSSHLLHGPRLKNRPNFGAIEEFLLRGLKYVFPPERGELTRGGRYVVCRRAALQNRRSRERADSRLAL